MKVITIALVFAVLLASVPVVLAGPPTPPMPEFLKLYFQVEQEIAQGHFDKQTRDTLYLLLDNAWTVWMSGSYVAISNAKAVKMAQSILETIQKLRNGAVPFSGSITLMVTPGYMVQCKSFVVQGVRWYVCPDVTIYCKWYSCTRWTNG